RLRFRCVPETASTLPQRRGAGCASSYRLRHESRGAVRRDARGTRRAVLRRHLGTGIFRLGLGSEPQKFATLLVCFSRGPVHKYHLAERKPVRQLLADIRKTPTPTAPDLLSELPPERGLDAAPVARVPWRIGRAMTNVDVERSLPLSETRGDATK